MFDGVSGDFLKDGDGRRLRLPGPKAVGFRAVEYHPRQIERARRRIGADRVRAEFGVTPRGELTQRHRGAGAAGDVSETIRRGEFGRGELLDEQRHEIARVEAIADLVAVAAETDVLERAVAQVRVEPVGENALVGAAELAGAREDAAAIHKNR